MIDNIIQAPEYGMTFERITNPHEKLEVPDSWSNVRDFANWWMAAGMPMVFPTNPEVFLSDDATAISIFRKGRFQVEMYLIHAFPKVPEHEHPGVEVIKMSMTHNKNPIMSNILKDGESHGAGVRLETETIGFPLIAFQHWLTREPTTIASMWKGPTVGPLHEALIKRFNPDAYVIRGYADTTRQQEKQ
jgi:hypothetical protein